MLNRFKLFKSFYANAQQCGFERFLTRAATRPLSECTAKMQAWQIQTYGDINQLQLASFNIPHLSEPDQLLIKVKATSLNPIDLQMLGGYGKSLFGLFRWYQTEFPLILGREFAGTIVDKGRSVTNDDFKIGDNIYGIVPIQKQGCQAEYVLADKSQVLLRPTDLTPVEAASVLYASITAWSALFLTGELALRDPTKTKVLILGASGGVGTLATQILKSQGVKVVGVCAADAIPLVISLGAEHAYDYRDAEHITKVATFGTYDIILDCAKYGYQKVPKNWKYKKYITLNSPLLNNTDRLGLVAGLAVSASEMVGTNISGLFSGRSVKWGFFLPQSSAFHLIGSLVRNKQLKPIIHKVFKFKEVPEAYKMLAAGHLRGKLVIDVEEKD